MINKKRIAYIKQFRRDYNLTQEQAGRKLGYHRRTIANYEQGQKEVSEKFVRAVYAYIKMNPLNQL